MNTKLFSFFDESTGILTTQQAPYIEDGWYIEAHVDGKFRVFEIPEHGGENAEHGEFDSFKLAYDFAMTLT